MNKKESLWRVSPGVGTSWLGYMLRRSLPRGFIIVKTVFIRHVPPINFPTFFMFFVFSGVNYCRSRLKKRSTPSQGVAIKKKSVSSRTCHFYRQPANQIDKIF